jgi:hypothetical protein
MSFENKGFPNSLNKQFDSLNSNALNYDDSENFGGLNATSLSNLANIVKTDNRLNTEKNKPKTRVKKVKTPRVKKPFESTFLGGLLSGVFKGGTDSESKGIVEGGGLSTIENPAQLPEYVVEAQRKPQASKMKYFYYIIAIILIILIYKQFKK